MKDEAINSKLTESLEATEDLKLGDDISHEDIRECFNCCRFY